MILIPAIDLKGGKVVRLQQGKAEKVTSYSDNPVQIAKHWEAQGASWLHLVDLDGAFKGKSIHARTIQRIAEAVSIPVELGGGLRNLQAIERALECGIHRVILGSAAVTRPEVVLKAIEKFTSEKIVLGVDALNGKIATHGWTDVTAVTLFDFLRKWEKTGLTRIVYTDISRDGMLSGPNLKELIEINASFSFRIILSGGISDENEITKLCEAKLRYLEGVIVGKALYDGRIQLKKLIRKMEQSGC
ncbi:1-(5-phosphoribosyl)-5-[(5-phosphoribosylamino) methylideneamino] imidazole-4-carboxamide isomerase [bacterium BMS3Abin05]|nr:1-(5-phosphoribosyl)-5-[(5-phosphoribosylamino) methylideneamino] imidazole-4-carboxamide isomerase [bacterium BMS3Abin05]GBE26847.1 1-(5-phosphoribosyl)-5-[(5-phosphoribosylamino) methylideneamino] imidazole-4-carboxamide isomerase [bacterium BMS3Bbin03]HDZ11099.1 1-(5-phosphoribosyl)-5-[(5-phosphoribosylamino)methylideneamino]imidazole-4-carboxamide isomerase [Bacteroidota bacterium]